MSIPPDQLPPEPAAQTPSSPPTPPRPDPATDAPEAAAHGSDERNLAMLTHLSGLLLSIVVPLVIWLLHKDQPDKRYLVAEAKEALNFQITVLIGYVICAILTVVVIGVFLFYLLWIVNLVFCILAALQVSNTGTYRYPFGLRLIS